MSSTFVTVDHTKLMNMMHDELHMMHVLISEIRNVKIVNKTGPDIHIEICQDDVLSALMFIVSLTFLVKPLPPVISAIDFYKPLW